MEYTVGGGRKQILLTILIITSALSHPKRLVLHNSKSLPLLRNRNLGRLTVRQSLRGGRKQPSLYSREFGRRKGAIHCSINENADATPTIQAPETQLGQDLKLDLLKLSLSEMENLMSSFGEPKFRAKQLHKAIFDTRIQSFSEMSALPTKVREKLERAATIGSLKIAKEQVSKDGTIKRAYALHDDRLIESVLMPYDDGRYTACISSQAGCAQGCVFCATGQMGFGRHLSSDEIFEQAFRFSQELQQEGKRLSNVVFMGMGEPFANYDNVINALNRIHGTLNIGWRHVTVSTVGIVPKIYEFADMNSQVTLAVSLHCANDEKRGDLMPVNRRWSVAELIQVREKSMNSENLESQY